MSSDCAAALRNAAMILLNLKGMLFSTDDDDIDVDVQYVDECIRRTHMPALIDSDDDDDTFD